MFVDMKRLPPSSSQYQHHEQKFYESWQHSNKTAEVKSIFYAEDDVILNSYRGKRFSRYNILNESFKVEHAAPGMFGAGIYSTPTSSKADVYAKNHHVASHLHAIFICRVVYGNTETKYLADNTITGPSPGFDSVKGVTKQNGGSVVFPEVVVYRDDAIIPVGLIFYTRKGWEPN